MSNILEVTFAEGQTFVTATRLWQGDYGQILKILGLDLPDYYEMHFASSKDGTPETQVGTPDGVSIPNKFLRNNGYIYAWVFLHAGEDDGETKYQIKIPVEEKGIPIDQETPEDKTAVQEAIQALNAETKRAQELNEQTGEYKDQAQDAAVLAESWAVGETGTRLGEDYDNAKFYAQMAQQGAAKSGYAYFHTDPETGEIIATVASNLDEDIQFAINEQTGEMEVEFK